MEEKRQERTEEQGKNRCGGHIFFPKRKWVMPVLLTGAVYFFLKYISPLLTPVVIAGMFLTFCYPTFDDIQKKTHIKKQYLASAILILAGAALIILVWLGGSLLLKQIPVWINGLDDVEAGVNYAIAGCCKGVGDFLGVDTQPFETLVLEQVEIFIENFQVQVLPGMLGSSFGLLKQLFAVIAVLAVTVIATILFAKDYDAILAEVGAHKESRIVLEIFLRVIRYLGTYVKAQFLILLIIAAVCMLGLGLGGIRYGVILGAAAGLLDALPFIGTGIVLTPIAIWQLVEGNYVRAGICLALYIICALLREFLEPKLIGEKVGIYPVAILISVYAGLKLFGLAGIIKGPIGLVIIMQTYRAYRGFVDEAEERERGNE